MKNITISEYGYIGCDNGLISETFVGRRNINPGLFKEVYDFWHKDKDAQKIFTFENENCLKATNYVGIIQTKSLSIEILPKIYYNPANCPAVKNDYRYIFMEMLKPLLNINEIQINRANLSTAQNKNIYERFIILFVESMDKLIYKGIKSDYILQEGNQFFLKGKLKFNQHIKQNYIHKERFYVETDEYLQDRTVNRLLKSTIALLLKKTNDFENKRKLRQQLFIFDEVQFSNNPEMDFKKVNKYRGMEHYDLPLRFAEVFLTHKSFTSLRGKDNVFALLFPMEKVFENYMEFVLNNSKDILGIKKVNVNGFTGDWLLSDVSDNGCNMVNLQPDYLLEMKNKSNIVTDAKWKLLDINEKLDGSCEKVNLAVGDVYQVFSYLNFYKNITNTAYLFVPKVDNIKKTTFKYNNKGKYSPNKKIKIIPIYLQELIENNHILNKSYLKLVKEKM